MLVLLGILDQFARAFDADGRRTAEGQRLYWNYFAGDNALFSDSSDTEKRDFRKGAGLKLSDSGGFEAGLSGMRRAG